MFYHFSWQSSGVGAHVVIRGNSDIFPHHLSIACIIQRLPVLLSVWWPGVVGLALHTAALHQGVSVPGLVLFPGDVGVSGTHQDGTARVISHHGL